MGGLILTERRTFRRGGVILVMSLLALTGCTEEMTVVEPDSSDTDLLQRQMNDSLTRQGHEVYAGAGGTGDSSIGIELPLNRDGLALYAVCAGPVGMAAITLNEEGPFDFPCGEDEPAREIARSLAVQGNRLLIAVDGVPATAEWALTAVSTG